MDRIQSKDYYPQKTTTLTTTPSSSSLLNNKKRNKKQPPISSMSSSMSIHQILVLSLVLFVCLSLWFNTNALVWLNMKVMVVNLKQQQQQETTTQQDPAPRKQRNNKNNNKSKATTRTNITKGDDDFQFPTYPKLASNKILEDPNEIQMWSTWAKEPLVGSYRVIIDNDNDNDNNKKEEATTAYIHYPFVDLENNVRNNKQGTQNFSSSSSSSSTTTTILVSNYTNTNTTTTGGRGGGGGGGFVVVVVDDDDQQKRDDSLDSNNKVLLLTRKGVKHNTPDKTCGIDLRCNQDRVVSLEFNNNDDDWWIGLFDGHGSYGHIISQYASYEFPKLLLKEVAITTTTTTTTASSSSSSSSSSSADSETETTNATTTTTSDINIINNIFSDIQNSMPILPGTILLSGSTAISVWKHQHNLIISTLGDSTAFVASYNYNKGNNKIEDLQLVYKSKPHKPDDPNERQRIESMGGKVLESKPARIIIPDSKSKPIERFQLLATSRSLGNHDGARFGMSCKPVTSIIDLSTLDKTKSYLVVAASDGLMTNGIDWIQITTQLGLSFANDNDNNADADDADSSSSNNNINPTPIEVAAEKLILQASKNWQTIDHRDDISIAVRQLEL